MRIDEIVLRTVQPTRHYTPEAPRRQRMFYLRGREGRFFGSVLHSACFKRKTLVQPLPLPLEPRLVLGGFC